MKRRLSLNGLWRYMPQAHVVLKADGTLAEQVEALPAGGTMEIPANWQLQGLDNFHGRVRFERDFTFDGMQEEEASIWLHFSAVDYFATVWLNGELLGRHEGYFQAFRFDVSHLIKEGENRLVVDVTCPLEEPGPVWPDQKRLIKGVLSHWDCRPGSWDLVTGQDQNSGGIWNDVYLETQATAFLDNIRVQTRLVPLHAPSAFDIATVVNQVFDPEGPQQAIVQVDAEIHGPRGRYTVAVQIGSEPAVEQIVQVEQSGQPTTIVIQIPEPKLWWSWDLGEPHLEECVITLQQAERRLDAQQMEIGLREIRFDAPRGEWYLNGKRFFMRGTNVVPTLWLSEYDAAMIAKDIEMLRAAHINGVRVCVHINRPEFYAACDKAGILIWQDFALQWGYVVTTDFMQEAVRQVKDMVRMLANHPSVALWCCQNESSLYNAHVLGPVLAAAIAAEDGSRPIHSHSEFQEHAYPGWYKGHYREYVALPGTPILTEFGAQALPREETMRKIGGDQWPPDWDRLAYHDFQYDQTFNVAAIELGESWAEFVRNSQTYQARLLKFAIERYRRAKYSKLGGLFQFMLMECWPSITWAVVEYDRTPKAAYHTLKEVYQPVLIGQNLERDKVLLRTDRGAHLRPIVITPWIVNDLQEALQSCTYSVHIANNGGSRAWTSTASFDVPADGVLEQAPSLVIAEDLAPGHYELTLTLHNGGQAISVNHYPVEIASLP